MNTQDRDQFEIWAQSQGMNVATYNSLYVSKITEHYWDCWQESRNAVVVELPDHLDTDRLGFPAYEAAEVDRAIEAQGLKVAP